MKILRIASVIALSSFSAFLVYYFIKRKRLRKSVTVEITSPFPINTLNRQIIGWNKETEAKWSGPFTFIQAADTQFGLIDNTVYQKPQIKWDKEIYLLRLVIKSVNSLEPKPKFFVVCGDLVDAFPYSALKKPQIQDLKRIFGELDPKIKLICVCGNHDIGDIPTPDTIDLYKKDFGDDYFSFWFNGCKFITLNSQFFKNSTKVENLKNEHNKWLENELKKDTWKHLIIFQHIPWFLSHPEEPRDGIFNIDRQIRMEWLEKFKQAGVSKIFCGHYHRNSGGFYDNIEVIVTSAIGAQFGDDKHGYRLVQVDENEIKHRYIAVTDEVN